MRVGLLRFGTFACILLANRRAIQNYGMLLSDGGNIALTAASDTYTTHEWADRGIDSHSLFGVAVTDMEVVDLGPTISLTYDCVRNP